jgi:hypothetical protein
MALSETTMSTVRFSIPERPVVALTGRVSAGLRDSPG